MTDTIASDNGFVRILGVLAVDVAALALSLTAWMFVAAVVLTPMGAVPPLFLMFAVPIALGPGATWLLVAPRWGRLRPVRMVLPPLLASAAVSLAIVPLVRWLLDDPVISFVGPCAGLGYAVLLVGIAAAHWAPEG